MKSDTINSTAGNTVDRTDGHRVDDRDFNFRKEFKLWVGRHVNFELMPKTRMAQHIVFIRFLEYVRDTYSPETVVESDNGEALDSTASNYVSIRERRLESAKKYYHNNKEKVLAYQKEYNAKTKKVSKKEQRILDYMAQLECTREEAEMADFQERREKHLKQMKDYYERNREKAIAKTKEYRIKNKEKIDAYTKEYYREYYANKKAEKQKTSSGD